MKLIVGLGNPGKEYENTRHNIGFMVMDALAYHFDLSYNKNKFQGLYTDMILNDEKIIFLKPQKYMNLSGEVVFDFVKYFKIDINDILIISDDLDLPVGKIRIRAKGNSGGHNGLKNIELNLGTNSYKRLKIGIANNKLIDTKDYVLGKFNKEDYELIKNSITKTIDIVEDYLKIDFEKLMSKYN